MEIQAKKKRHAKASIIVAVLAFILCGAFAPTTKTEADSSEAQASLSSKKKADEAKKRSESIASSAKAESKRKAREKKAASEKKNSEEAESNKAASESIAQAQAHGASRLGGCAIADGLVTGRVAGDAVVANTPVNLE